MNDRLEFDNGEKSNEESQDACSQKDKKCDQRPHLCKVDHFSTSRYLKRSFLARLISYEF